MREGVEVRLRPGDRERLDGVVADRQSPQHHLWRARIVLMTADGAGTMAIRAATGKGKPKLWRWQARSMQGGADWLFTQHREALALRGCLAGDGHLRQPPALFGSVLWSGVG
jgi:hypothetical protein